MNKFPDVWDYGQLLAFSGIDGQTDFWDGMCLRTARNEYAFELKIHDPDQKAKICYTGAVPEKVELTGDFFRFYANGKVSCGVFADAWNFILDGEFQLVDTEAFYESETRDGRTLLAVKGRLHKAFLEESTEALIAKRAAFLESIP